jgi:hypothetical protein
MCFYSATGISFYSRQGVDVDKIMESNNLLIGHKYDKEIYVIERFVINVLWNGIISCLWVHADARLDVGEEMIIFRSVTFQNLVHNSCNAPVGGPPPQKSNQSGRLRPRIAGYTIILSDTKVTCNSFSIVLIIVYAIFS